MQNKFDERKVPTVTVLKRDVENEEGNRIRNLAESRQASAAGGILLNTPSFGVKRNHWSSEMMTSVWQEHLTP